MQIVHVSTSDAIGGASIAAHAIHRGLCDRGIESRMVVRRKETQDPTVYTLPLSPATIAAKSGRVLSRIASKLRSAEIANIQQAAFSYLSGTTSEFRFDPNALLPADLIQLNWVSNFIDWASFFRERPPVPLVWRLADMSPFTGLCHYSDGCDRFKNYCHHCPQASATGVDDVSENSFRLKQWLLSQLEPGDLTIICQSEWMAGLVSRSPILSRFSRHVIYNGVNQADFFPIEKSLARYTLGLDRNRPLVLIYGFSTEPRKGFEELVEAMNHFNLDRRHFLILGPRPWSRLHFDGWQVIESVQDRQLLRIIYSACDMMAFPSIQDNCPNAVIESIACGTPVLAFDGSGTEEIIEITKAGALSACRDFNQFVRRMMELLYDPTAIQTLQARCLPSIESRFKFENMLESYIRVYRSVLTNSV